MAASLYLFGRMVPHVICQILLKSSLVSEETLVILKIVFSDGSSKCKAVFIMEQVRLLHFLLLVDNLLFS